jgi:hypothetical protein
LPVRIHDFTSIKNDFGIANYEFHLSFRELDGKLPVFSGISKNKFTIHLPDYCSSTAILDPFSEDQSIRKESLRLVNKALEFADRLGSASSQEVQIVGSFSKVNKSGKDFYDLVSDFLADEVAGRGKINIQWLPPIAWYFGGSVQLEVMNNLDAVKRLIQNQLPIVMDTSHLFLGSQYFGFNEKDVLSELSSQSSWYHISAASGVDGEGNGFAGMDRVQSQVIRDLLHSDKIKVIEVWQGHLNNYEGFHLAFQDLYSLVNPGESL